MEGIGKIKDISRSMSGGFTIVMEVADMKLEELKKMCGCERLTISLKRYREKRSLDANRYYWELIGKLAEALEISKPRAHNLILRRYGQDEVIDGHLMIVYLPDTEEAEKRALEADTYHIRPTAQIKPGKDGVNYRAYIMRRGSSAYDTKEMSMLIDGLVSDCREMGIETLPSDELERMMSAYEQKHSDRVS